MTAVLPGPLVTTEWLAENLDNPRVRVLDGSFHLPAAGRDPREEFHDCHIPGAAFFDIDGIRDESTTLPHMLPSAERFSAIACLLGIDDDSIVVAYDAPGAMGAPRVWWTFRVFGHRSVAVLDGGLSKWLSEGRPVSDQPPAPRRAQYTARHNAALVRGIDDILANLAKHREQVIDARPAGRFAGSDPEPRPVKKQGHVPGSANIPAATLVDSYRHGLWRSPEDLARAFEDAGVNWRKPMITTCGSGVTACYTALAAFLLGNKTAAVYDGSWAEWGNRDDTPVEP